MPTTAVARNTVNSDSSESEIGPPINYSTHSQSVTSQEEKQVANPIT
jgi:hypothetical protein